MANPIKTNTPTSETVDNQVDPVSISARLLNLIMEMPATRQLELLAMLDQWRSDGARKHPRKKLSLPVDLEVDHRTFRGATSDISKGGLYIETQTSFSVNQEVKLSLQLPHKSKALTITGEIVRATARGIGIKFKSDTKR